MTVSPITRRYRRYKMQRAASAAMADALKQAPHILSLARQRRIAVLARRIPVPPLQPSAPSAPQPPRPKPVDWPRLSAAPFDPNAPPPPGVREYADARDRWAKIFDGSGCDGAIEATRCSRTASPATSARCGSR